MKLLKMMLLPLVFIFTLPLHVGHGDDLLRQKAPHFLLHLFSKFEHIVMRTIDFLANWDWVHRHALTKRVVDGLSHAIMGFISGEILTLDESRRLIEGIGSHGYTIATGTCPCRRARNILSDHLPNNTDMVFGTWAEEYLDNYPGLYERLTTEEALQLVEEFDRLGFIHQIYGFPMREGAAFVLCNCSPDVCIPLEAMHTRDYNAFRKGRAVAVVDSAACLGPEECGACFQRCQFGARSYSGGKSVVDRDRCHGCGVCVVACKGQATRMERKPGAQLIFARRIVD